MQLEQLKQQLPGQPLALLAQIGVPISGRGQESNSTSEKANQMSGAEQFAKITGGIASSGDMFGGRKKSWACFDYFEGDAPLFGRLFGGANYLPSVAPAPDGNAGTTSVNGQQPKCTPYKGALIPMRVDENGNVSFDSDAGFLGGLKRAVTLPGDVSAGRIRVPQSGNLKYDIEPETPGPISDAKAVVSKDFSGEPKDWLLSFYRFEDPPSSKSIGGATVSGPASLDRRTLPNVGPYEPIIKQVPLAPYQMIPYSAAHVIGDAVQRFFELPSTPQQQSEESAFRFDDLPNGKRTGGAAVSGPASPNRQTEANLNPSESARKAVPFASYQTMPYSAARLSGQTFEGQAPVLRLAPSQQQGDLDSPAVMRPPTDQSAAASVALAPSDDMNELLKLRAIVDAMGSRGLFPIQ